MGNKPNILMIVTDQHRYDCIGYSEQYPVKTPNIDRLAAEGIWFSEAYTPIPTCCPARQSLLHGRRAEAFGAHWNYDITLKVNTLSPEDYTWTKELQEAGYSTGYIGKWHVNPEYDATAYGFDENIGFKDGQELKEYHEFRENKHPDVKYNKKWFGEIDPIPLEDTETHWLAGKAADLIKKYSQKDEPWHIRVDFPEPHPPYRPVREFADMYNEKDIPAWGGFSDEFGNKPYIQKQQLLNWDLEDYTWEDWAPVVARYYAVISQVDDAVGCILNVIDDLNLTDDTIVIYTSDHGDMCGSHGMFDKHYIMYDDVVRVPLVIRWSGVIKAGTTTDKFVSHFLDLPPTILEILNLDVKQFFHGRSLLPLLKQNEDLTKWREEIISTYNGQQFGLFTQRMIRTRRWKLIWNPTDVDELYDMEQDPYELRNLIGFDEYKKIVLDLKERLYQRLKEDEDALLQGPWVEQQLLEDKKIVER